MARSCLVDLAISLHFIHTTEVTRVIVQLTNFKHNFFSGKVVTGPVVLYRFFWAPLHSGTDSQLIASMNSFSRVAVGICRVFAPQRTDHGPTDGWTDKPSYRDAWRHLKMN